MKKNEISEAAMMRGRRKSNGGISEGDAASWVEWRFERIGKYLRRIQFVLVFSSAVAFMPVLGDDGCTM
jgi:hypothetical protein